MLNAFANPMIPIIEVVVLVLHLIGWLAVLVPLLAVRLSIIHCESPAYKGQLAPAKATAHDVFTEFLNGGAWPTDGLSFLVGIIGSVFAMFGRPHLRRCIRMIIN